MIFRMWCRLGELPFVAPDAASALDVVAEYAVKHGQFVVLLDQDGCVLAEVPPAPQTDMIALLLFGEIDRAPLAGRTALN